MFSVHHQWSLLLYIVLFEKFSINWTLLAPGRDNGRHESRDAIPSASHVFNAAALFTACVEFPCVNENVAYAAQVHPQQRHSFRSKNSKIRCSMVQSKVDCLHVVKVIKNQDHVQILVGLFEIMCIIYVQLWIAKSLQIKKKCSVKALTTTYLYIIYIYIDSAFCGWNRASNNPSISPLGHVALAFTSQIGMSPNFRTSKCTLPWLAELQEWGFIVRSQSWRWDNLIVSWNLTV